MEQEFPQNPVYWKKLPTCISKRGDNELKGCNPVSLSHCGGLPHVDKSNAASAERRLQEDGGSLLIEGYSWSSDAQYIKMHFLIYPY